MGTIILASLFALPILGAAILIASRRSAHFRTLTPAILLSAVTTSILATCYGFSKLAMPIAPYETRGGFPWADLAKSILTLIYVGFGIGAVVASAVAIPATLITAWVKRRRQPRTPVEPPTLNA